MYIAVLTCMAVYVELFSFTKEGEAVGIQEKRKIHRRGAADDERNG